MNKERRNQLQEALALIAQAQEMIQDAQAEEEEYYDNMPESFQNGEKGEKAQTAIDALQNALDDLENVQTSVEEACEA